MNRRRYLATAFISCFLACTTAYAGGIVRIKCSVAPDWISNVIEVSTKKPKPTAEDVVGYFRRGNLHEIELSFKDDNQPVGIGTFLGQEVGYLGGESAVVFLLPAESGSDKAPSAILDRVKGRMLLQYPNSVPVEYVCAKQVPKF